eukprot:TRINITY_DN6874_c0_g1_i1.p1 TRINITY_DN6874_c0_g1~~TRINITY_DN6874_c0_g1_i1.p1  ORF type:complete len:341 (-),score=42.42 TRINITY_DN6874_c0_g1_i1:4-1026(-)
MSSHSNTSVALVYSTEAFQFALSPAESDLRLKHRLQNYRHDKDEDEELEVKGAILVVPPKEICFLAFLKRLFLTCLNLSFIPKEISNLTNLELLSFSRNRLSFLPPELGKLQQLRKLDLSHNTLTHLPSTIGRLTNLTNLKLRYNKLDGLPIDLLSITSLKTIDLKENQLVIPPASSVKGGLKEILSYLKDLKNSTTFCSRLKLMVVGAESVGKSSIVKSLQGKNKRGRRLKSFNKQPSNPTLGTLSSAGSQSGITRQDLTHIDVVDISEVTVDDSEKKHSITFSVWDFAGQEIYYAAHQLFMTEHSIYLLVWDLSKSEEENRISYWLQAITSKTSRTLR